MTSIEVVALVAFNLVCAGTTTKFDVVHGESSAAFTATYRIDLRNRAWCEGDCEVPISIDEVMPAAITLLRQKALRSNGDVFEDYIVIGRLDGAYIASNSIISPGGSPLMARHSRGTCVIAAFSGFPASPPPPTTKF